MTSSYVVQEGEWLLKIAQSHGFRTEQPLLDANPDLAATYGDNPNILPPGLEIEIPDFEKKTEAAASGAEDHFVAVNKASSLSLTFQDAEGNPLVGWTGDLTIGEKSWPGLRLDGQGAFVVTRIPRDATVGQLLMTPPPDDEGNQAEPQTITVNIGSLDPIVEGDVGRRAIQKMLTNLGFYDGPIDGDLEGDTRDALAWFQEVTGVAGGDGPDGLADDQTCRQLVEVQGNEMPPPVAPEAAAT